MPQKKFFPCFFRTHTNLPHICFICGDGFLSGKDALAHRDIQHADRLKNRYGNNAYKLGPMARSVSSASDSCAKDGKLEPYCQQIDSAYHPFVGW